MVQTLLFSLFALRVWSAPLDCPHQPFSFNLTVKQNPAKIKEYTLTFPSLIKSRFKSNNTVWAHYSLPQGTGPFPAVLVLPVMAAPNLWIEKKFVHQFNQNGLAVLLIETPYQFHRKPSALIPSGSVFLARNPDILAQNFRQSVSDSCRALSWLSHQPEIDPHAIGIFGISLGALVGSTVYSASSIPQYGVFLLGGADLPSLLFHSEMTAPFVKKIGISESRLRQVWQGLDVLDYEKENLHKPVLLINANSDSVIPRKNALELKKAFPESRQLWVPFGHYTALLHLVWIPRYVANVFIRHLKS